MFSRATTQVFIAIISIVLFIGYSANPPNGRTGAPGDGACSDCHSGNASFDGSVTISGLPADVMAGNTYPLTITVSNPNGLASKGGFQIVGLNSSNTNSGTLSNPGANTTISTSSGRNYHEHNPAQNFPGSNMINYTVDWTAPSGPNGEQITFYGASNIANGNGNTSGDKIVFTTQSTNLVANVTPPIVDIHIINEISCNGAADATAEATASDGTPPYNYVWSNGQNGNLATNLGPGTYTVTATDDGGLSATDMISISEPPILTGSHMILSHVSCAGGMDGAASIAASGGTPGYNYSWSNGATTAIVESLSAGNYGYTITDINGCTFSSSLLITEPLEITNTIEIISPPSCPGAADGTVSVSSMGGTPPYTYEWSNGTEGPIQSDLSAGMYTITTTDAKGCKSVSDFQLFNPDGISIILDTIIHISCFGENNGSLSVSAVEGNGPPYSFTWSNGSNANHILDLSGGDYTVTVSDANGCTATETYTIEEPDSLIANATILNEVLCYGDSTGAVNIVVSGGTNPYEYIWSNGYTGGQMNNNIPAGNYTVTLIDANNCTDSTLFVISEPDSLIVNMSSTNESFPGANDGIASANPAGGTAPYMYLWSNDSTSQTIQNLTASIYSVTVTDSNGCSIEGSVQINVGDCDLTITETIVNVSCYGGQDGAASVNVMGGVEPYGFLWQDGTMDTSLLMQTAGTYGLTITDSVSCSIALSLTIDEPDSLQIDFNSINPACPNDSTGSVQATINGGMPPFSVLWSTGDTTSQISNIPPGNYSISVTDSNNCTASQNTFLDYLDDIAPIMELKDISVYLNENGITEVIETEDFIESLGDNCGGQVTVSFLAAAYSCEDLDSLFTIPVIAIDEQGNSTEDSFQLTVVDTLPPEIICMPDVTINGCAPFEYDLPEASDNCEISSINLVSGLGSGSVFPIGETEEVYIVTDQSGNTATCSFTVLATGDLNVTIEIFNESCREACDGEAIITILGGTPPYSIDPEILFDLCPGDYIVTITDAAGCSTNVSFTIQEAPDFEITNIEAQDASSTADDGFIDITVEGGTEPLSYSWTKDGQPFSTEEDISGLAPGLYACVVTDANGCIVFTDEIIINMETFINNLALDDQVKIFPNPASDLIIIEYEFDASAILDIQVKGMDGKRFIALQNPASENIVLNISDVPEGLYMIHLNTAVGHFVKRVLIVR